jgi:glycosyltransferase involved in cell wall biosynthesis
MNRNESGKIKWEEPFGGNGYSKEGSPDSQYIMPEGLIPRKVVLITTGQPSTDPRLIKEADCLSEQGFDVIVLYQYWSSWAEETDKKLVAGKKFRIRQLGGSPKKEKWIYMFTRLSQKIAGVLTKMKIYDFGIAGHALCRSYYLLLSAAKKCKADLYIAHNLGALGIAVHAAHANKSYCGFDAEDFHRFEEENDPKATKSMLKAFLEQKYFQRLNYITTASPLITKAYTALFPSLKFSTILNVFPKRSQSLNKEKTSLPIKLAWFSQTVGLNRGIDDVINALGLITECRPELHILGNINNNVRNKLKELARKNNLCHQLFFYEPIPGENIYHFLQGFDIGLALEPGFSINNNIALSNKIFKYMQAGLSLIVSDTEAQKLFYEQNRETGFCYERGNVCSLAEIILKLSNDRDLLHNQQKESLEKFNNRYNWEKEQLIFLNCINQVFQK